MQRSSPSIRFHAVCEWRRADAVHQTKYRDRSACSDAVATVEASRLVFEKSGVAYARRRMRARWMLIIRRSSQQESACSLEFLLIIGTR
jgi:hypothetical protein